MQREHTAVFSFLQRRYPGANHSLSCLQSVLILELRTMSHLSNLGAAFSGGGVAIEPLLTAHAWRWNEAIPVTIRITGGNRALNGCDVIAYVREHWTTTDDDGDETDHYKRYSETSLATQIQVEAGQQY